jgi:hypothetical protein
MSREESISYRSFFDAPVASRRGARVSSRSLLPSFYPSSLGRGRFDRVRARVALEKSRPLSRVLSWAAIPLGCASPRSSSDLPGSPCGPHVTAFRPSASLFGLAPGGVCRAVGVAASAVRSYRTISPLPAPLTRRLGGIFLLHFPWTRVPQALPGTLALWSPDFPPCAKHTAAAWPTLSAHHTPVSARARACRPRCGARRRSVRRAARLA